MARLGRLMMTSALTMAQVVDLMTRSQLGQHLGALPVLYALLEVLQVRETINRHCRTKAEIDHGWKSSTACPGLVEGMTGWDERWMQSANTVETSGRTSYTVLWCGQR